MPQNSSTHKPPAVSWPLMEAFYTIQGEGHYQGHAAYFVRLAGCNLGCVWCDSKESWDKDKYPFVSAEDIIRQAKTSGSEICVVTGGEPAQYDLNELTGKLIQAGIKPNLETSGAYPLTGQWHWICYSPKKFFKPHPTVAKQAHELKIVIFNKSDFAWAEAQARTVNPACQLFLQPEWSRQSELLSPIVEYVKSNPKWRLSVQLHKYINEP